MNILYLGVFVFEFHYYTTALMVISFCQNKETVVCHIDWSSMIITI